jgi:hypothetical protein
MNSLQILGKLIEQQQYELLLQHCETFWQDKPQPAILGIGSFACTLLGKNEVAPACLAQGCSSSLNDMDRQIFNEKDV